MTNLKRLRRAGVVLAATIAALAGFSQPAAAVTSIEIQISITPYDSTTNLLEYHVYLPSNQWDGQGYINNGAQIKVKCYAFSDGRRLYSRIHRGTSSQPLYATEDGIHLDGVYYDTSRIFNTSGDARRDWVQCNAIWMDGDGGALGAISNNAGGFF